MRFSTTATTPSSSAPAAPACALHKLRWGSDPLFSEKADIEDEVHDEAPPASGGMKRTLTKTSITLNTEDERSKKYHSGEEPGKGWVFIGAGADIAAELARDFPAAVIAESCDGVSLGAEHKVAYVGGLDATANYISEIGRASCRERV